jgi:hypothetical protein
VIQAGPREPAINGRIQANVPERMTDHVRTIIPIALVLPVGRAATVHADDQEVGVLDATLEATPREAHPLDVTPLRSPADFISEVLVIKVPNAGSIILKIKVKAMLPQPKANETMTAVTTPIETLTQKAKNQIKREVRVFVRDGSKP